MLNLCLRQSRNQLRPSQCLAYLPVRCVQSGGFRFIPKHTPLAGASIEKAPLDPPDECQLLATSGCSGHAAGPTALPLKADLRAAMSASPPTSSASPPGADLPADAPVRLVLTRSRNGREAEMIIRLNSSRSYSKQTSHNSFSTDRHASVVGSRECTSGKCRFRGMNLES